jgi:hypothetical protein
VAHVLHPIDVQIIEAFERIDQSLSMGDLRQIFDDELSSAVATHHMRRLATLGAIEPEEAPTIENMTSIAYRLVRRPPDER